jgi:hypothetical protein
VRIPQAQAVFAGMMIGPAQVAARVMEASVLGRFQPLVSPRLACITHPIGACVMGIFGGGAAAAFALLRRPGPLRRWPLSRSDCCWSLWGAASWWFRRASAFRR